MRESRKQTPEETAEATKRYREFEEWLSTGERYDITTEMHRWYVVLHARAADRKEIKEVIEEIRACEDPECMLQLAEEIEGLL